LGGLKGEAAIYSIEADKLERQLPVNEAVTNTLWAGNNLFFATSQGNVKAYEAGSETASASEHAGPVTGLSAHPGAEILGSVGTDKSIVFYDVATMKRVSRAFADACKYQPAAFMTLECILG
jgi:pre-mRNA-processing factor 19